MGKERQYVNTKYLSVLCILVATPAPVSLTHYFAGDVTICRQVPSYSQAHYTRCNTLKSPSPARPKPYKAMSMLWEIYMKISCNFTVKDTHTHLDYYSFMKR